MSETSTDISVDRAVIRQKFMLPLVLIGVIASPVFAFIEWHQDDIVSMVGDGLLTAILMAVLVMLLSDMNVDMACRFCVAGLLANWALVAPFGGVSVDHLLFIWWPVFPLVVFFLIPSKEESQRWFTLFMALLFLDGLYFEYSGRMADDSLPYWSALFVTLFAAYVVSRWIEMVSIYQQRMEAGSRELREQAELQEIMSRELVQAKKLEEIGLATGGIAHDFNNILSVIVGHTEVLHHELDVVDMDVAESLKMISLGATRGAHLARELLAFAGKAQFENGPIYLDHIVQDMTTLQRIHMSKRIKMELNVRPVPALKGDSTPFEQMVLNLVRNAIDAMDGRSGRVVIGTDLVELSQQEIESLDLFAGQGPGRFIRMWVQDEGCGIREGERQQVFAPFFTTKEGGSGLGLASLKNHIRRHHGGIRLESEYGVGTTFTLYFPAPEVELPEQIRLPRDRGVAAVLQSTRS